MTVRHTTQMRTICPHVMIVTTPVYADGQVDVHSMRVGQHEYCADTAGDSIYTAEEAKLDQEYRFTYVWNKEENTFESYDLLHDAVATISMTTSFCYRNEPVMNSDGELVALTQIFYYF